MNHPVQLNSMRCVAIGIACSVLAAMGVARASCQELASADREEAARFQKDAEHEASLGTYIFYRQEYRDQRKEHVSIHGSVYGVLRDVKLNGCEVEGTILVNDLFSGLIKSRPAGEQQDTTEYFIRLAITPEIASTLTVFEARPSQLAHAMHTECDGDGSCSFHWLRIQSPQAAMHERIVMNGSVTFDGAVKQVIAPVSSREVGERLLRDLQALAKSECRVPQQ